MRLPNGFGSVYKLSGKRRKPWVARKTIGWNNNIEKGTCYPIYKIIGYYENKKDALKALVEFNENPNIFDNTNITFKEVYEKWSDKKFENISRSHVLGYRAAYKVCNSIYDMNFKNIKTTHLQDIIDTCGKNYPTLRKIKVLFNQLYSYALKNDICDKDYSKFIDIGKNTTSKEKDKFSSDDINKLWKMVESNEYVQVILILIYTGVRISELLDLKKEDINLEKQYFFVRKSKTDNGVRQVPIANKILPFFINWYKKPNDYLICTNDNKKMVYRNYLDSYWKPFIDELSLNYTPHSTRHTTISLLAAANISQTIIKKIVGHSGAMTLTEKVYTHFDIKPLLDAINSI